MIYSRKTGKYLNQFFLLEVDQESCGWNSICQILILPLWLVTPSCFLVKTSQILQKVIIFFPEKKERLHSDIFGQLSGWRFLALLLISSILAVFRWKRGVKFGPKVLTLGSSLFHKYLNPSKNFQTVLLFKTFSSLVRISAILDHIGRVRAQKPSKKGYFVCGCWIGTQNFRNF